MTERRGSDTSPITNISTYRTPFLCMLNGQPVRVVATGSQEGHSQVNQYVGQDRQLAWESEDRFQIIDPSILPPSLQQVREMLKNL